MLEIRTLHEDAPLNGGHGPYHPLEPEGGWPCEMTPAVGFVPTMLGTGESWKGHKGGEDLGRDERVESQRDRIFLEGLVQIVVEAIPI